MNCEMVKIGDFVPDPARGVYQCPRCKKKAVSTTGRIVSVCKCIGLGDVIHRALAAFKITPANIEKWTGRKCKCQKRIKDWNRLFIRRTV